MANKQTKRERRELSKKERLEAQRRAARRRRLRQVYTAATVLAVAAGIALLVWLSGRSSREGLASLNAAATAGGCETLQSFASEGREHIPPTQKATYKTSPPTSGPHATPSDTGVHQTPVPEVNQIHNLEHGHVVIQYKENIPDAAKKALEDLARKDPQWVLTAPNPDMQPTIAFTAWTNMVRCANEPATYTDASALTEIGKRFISRFKGSTNAPEKVAGSARQ